MGRRQVLWSCLHARSGGRPAVAGLSLTRYKPGLYAEWVGTVTLSAHVPDLSALEVLLGVAGSGSLNAAARQAGVSQQAVSARIRAMEAQTGVTLVHRTPRGSTLTADGAVIAEWAARLLDVAAGLDAGIAALRQDRRARLRVSASSTIAEQLLPGWLASFRAAAPPGPPASDIVLTAANTEQVIGHVAAGSADIGFTEGPRRPPGLRSKIIGQDRLVVVVAPGHRWARRRAASAAELAGTPLVIREGGSGTRDTLAAALAAALGTDAGQVPPRCRYPPPWPSARLCWPTPPPPSSANSPSPRTWPPGGSPRSQHPSWTCAGCCGRSGTAPRSRPQARRGT